MTKVTVYSPCYNYADYARQAIESVVAQSFTDWELIVIDDGSTDGSLDVLNEYAGHPQIRIVAQENKGLNVTNNIALRLARGKYVMRLDADDYLDENALLVLSKALDTRPEVGLVYPDYFHVDKKGGILELVRRKKIGEEVELFDLPAHGACTMFRRDVLLQLEGYLEDYSCQDGYELWLRFIRRFSPYNVNIPLFYYRQHGTNLTSKQNRILDTRRQIKRDFVEREFNGDRPKVLGIIPVAHRSPYPKNDPFVELAGKPLIWYTLETARKSRMLDRVALSTRNRDVLGYVADFPFVTPIERPKGLSSQGNREVALHVLEVLKEREGYEADAVCLLFVNTPLRAAHHVDWAVDTLKVFGVDSVISIQEEIAPCYHHERFGLRPINSVDGIRLEREAIFKANGAINLTRTEVINSGAFLGEKVGHVTMLPEESVKINSEFEFWMAEKILTDWGNEG